MVSLSVRNLSDETHAAHNCLRTEAEAKAILDGAMSRKETVGIGSMLASIGRDLGGVDLDIARDATPTDPALFE